MFRDAGSLRDHAQPETTTRGTRAIRPRGDRAAREPGTRAAAKRADAHLHERDARRCGPVEELTMIQVHLLGANVAQVTLIDIEIEGTAFEGNTMLAREHGKWRVAELGV